MIPNLAMAIMFFASSLEFLIFGRLLRTTPMTPEQIQGQNLFRFSERNIKLNTPMWSRWMMKLSIRDGGLFTDYEKWFKTLKCEAQRCVYQIQDNIPEMFFRICEELGIPAGLLDRGDLVESLSKVFIYILHLSDELRSAVPESPEFLEKLQHYKRIMDAFRNLQFGKGFFSSDEELRLFFERMDEKLQQLEKAPLSEHKISAITNLFIQTDFVMDGFFEPVPQFEDFLRLMLSAIMRKYYSCVGESDDEHMSEFCRKWFLDKQVAYSLIEELCKIFEDFEKHPLFRMTGMKLNVMCKLLHWDEFTGFLQLIRDRHPDEHEFICLTMKSMADSIQADNTAEMDDVYASVLSRYPSGGFVTTRAQIVDFVSSQLSITGTFRQVVDVEEEDVEEEDVEDSSDDEEE